MFIQTYIFYIIAAMYVAIMKYNKRPTQRLRKGIDVLSSWLERFANRYLFVFDMNTRVTVALRDTVNATKNGDWEFLGGDGLIALYNTIAMLHRCKWDTPSYASVPVVYNRGYLICTYASGEHPAIFGEQFTHGHFGKYPVSCFAAFSNNDVDVLERFIAGASNREPLSWESYAEVVDRPDISNYDVAERAYKCEGDVNAMKYYINDIIESACSCVAPERVKESASVVRATPQKAAASSTGLRMMQLV